MTLITDVKCFPVSIPLKRPMRMSKRTIDTADNIIVRITDSEGNVGWGEAASAPRMTGETQKGMCAAVNEFMTPVALYADPTRYRLIMASIDKALNNNSGAKSAFECALIDLAGKVLNVSAHVLFGGKIRDSFPIVHILSDNDITDMLEEVREYRDHVDMFKIKIGNSLIYDIQKTFEVREQAIDNEICVDVNNGMTLSDAITYCDQTAKVGLSFIEQPLSVDHDHMIDRIPLPVCLDQSVASLRDIKRITSNRMVDGVNLKTISLSGMTSVYKAAEMCHSAGMFVHLSSKVAESSIAAAAVTQLGLVVPNIDWGVSLTNKYLASDLAVLDPDVPGMGIIVDEDAIDQFMVIL